MGAQSRRSSPRVERQPPSRRKEPRRPVDMGQRASGRDDATPLGRRGPRFAGGAPSPSGRPGRGCRRGDAGEPTEGRESRTTSEWRGAGREPGAQASKGPAAPAGRPAAMPSGARGNGAMTGFPRTMSPPRSRCLTLKLSRYGESIVPPLRFVKGLVARRRDAGG
jgi:hypothetical protein